MLLGVENIAKTRSARPHEIGPEDILVIITPIIDESQNTGKGGEQKHVPLLRL